MIKRIWLLIPLAIAVAALIWMVTADSADFKSLQSAIGLKSPSVERSRAKPICSSPVNPNVAAPTDCIPQHMANLPRHPGKAALTEFIDTNKDGVRDDVEIAIEDKFGSSRRAVAAARQVAIAAQLTVAAGATGISHADAKALAAEKTMKAVDCFVLSVDPPLNSSRHLQDILLAVADTEERFVNRRKFELAASGHVYELKLDTPLSEVCGYDPASLPN